jgi:hypothetical protein
VVSDHPRLGRESRIGVLRRFDLDRDRSVKRVSCMSATTHVSSSSARIPVLEKIRELYLIFRETATTAIGEDSVAGVFDSIAEYEMLAQRYGSLDVFREKALEIGFGARALRLSALCSVGIDAEGVDLDVPFFGWPSDLWQIYRRNGVERAIKSAIRFPFDVLIRRRLGAELQRRFGKPLIIPRGRMTVSDAAVLDQPSQSFGFIVSEDVFEHVPEKNLMALIEKMAVWLKREGLAFIRPNIFTGISGGHLAEWFCATASRHRSEPWEHLRKKRFAPNTYLNELRRSDYRRLFKSHFEILAEIEKQPGLGREHLTPDIRRELAAYPDEELFSNQVMFVLGRKP